MRWGAIVSLFLLALEFQHAGCLVIIVGRKNRADARRATSRRSFLQHGTLMIGATVTAPLVSHAQDVESPRDRGGKPFAPLEALLPATRLKIWIDDAHALTSSLKRTSDNKQAQYDTLKQLNDILSNPPKLFVSVPQRGRTLSSTAQLTTGVSSANKQEYKRSRSDLSVPDRLAAMLNQADVERQWGMLQYQESKLEQGNEMRAAFNYYTSQLEFGDSYLLTASPEDKKRMIRDEKLPTVTAVITSDLDVRELYRNTFLTTIEDAKAEVLYQTKQPVDMIDTIDTVDLMNQAYMACAEWFNLIAPQDIQDAVNVVLKESK